MRKEINMEFDSARKGSRVQQPEATHYFDWVVKTFKSLYLFIQCLLIPLLFIKGCYTLNSYQIITLSSKLTLSHPFWTLILTTGESTPCLS